MGVEDGDAVIAAMVSDGSDEVFIGTRDGMAIRFPEDDVRPMGRTAYGVRGISLARRRRRSWPWRSCRRAAPSCR